MKSNRMESSIESIESNHRINRIGIESNRIVTLQHLHGVREISRFDGGWRKEEG